MDMCSLLSPCSRRKNIEFRVPYSQQYLFNAIPDTNHNANPAILQKWVPYSQQYLLLGLVGLVGLGLPLL